MENLDKKINVMKKYPSKETMELFLEIWTKLNLFDTVDINTKEWQKEKWYKSINAVRTLSIVVEYIQKPWNSEEKEKLVQILNWWNKYDFCKYLWNLALDIWANNSPSQFWLSMIISNRKAISEQKEWSNIFFPVITSNQMPDRYENADANHLIHEEFVAELARLKWVESWADQIQAESANHTFDRWVNNWEIKDLEDKL